MSFGTASVDVELDAKRAVDQLRGLLQTIASSNATVTLSVNVSNVAPQVEGAIDSADSEVEVTGNATEVTGAIDGSIDAADSEVEVTGNASEVTGAIDGSVDAADTAVEVTGDAAQVTGSIDGAVQAADTAVEVSGDATQITGAINGAVQAADTHVQIDADDSGGLSNINEALGGLNLSLIAAQGGGLRLRAIFKALSAAGLTTGLFEAAQAASDLGESTSKATVVFGKGIDQVKAFSATSAEAIGLSEQAALEATATFGNLFTALGATKAQATNLAPSVVTLAADLASFNNLDIDDVLIKLRSGLVGEIEPLRSLGISFNAAQVEAKAMELGLADANGTVTEGAKLQARWVLILEQSTTAQGDFARTSSGLANQQRILSAEFHNAVTEVGQGLLPALLEAVKTARSELIPAFQQFGTETLPGLVDAFVSLLPVIGSFGQIVTALTPAISFVGKAIGSIPPELLTFIGLLRLANRFSPLLLNGLGSLAKGFSRLADPNQGPGGFTKSLSQSIGATVAAAAPTVGLSLVLATVGVAFQENAQKAAQFKQAVSTIKGALDDGKGAAESFANVFQTLVDQGGSAANVLAALGLDAKTFGQLVSKGGDLTSIFAHAIGTTKDQLGVLNLFFEQFNDQLQAASKLQVEAIKSSGDLSEQTIKNAEATHTHSEAVLGLNVKTTDYVAVLADLQNAQVEAAAQIGVTTDETGKLVEATGPAADAAQVLALSLAQITQAGGKLSSEYTGLALAAGNARVADEDLQNAADNLGVSLDDLKTFVGTVNDAINQFADDTLQTIPSIGDIIGDLGDKFSPQALLDKLKEATTAIADFSDNLNSLAAFPAVQQIAATNGPLVAAALAQPVKDGNTEILTQLENQANAFNLHYAGLDNELRTKLGPNIADATGVTAKAMTDAFGSNFDPASKVDEATNETIASIEDEAANPDTKTAGKHLADSYVGGFSTGIGGMPTATVHAAENSSQQLNDQGPFAQIAGLFFGASYVGGQKTGLGGMPTATVSSASASTRALNNQGPFARIAGVLFGGSMSGGTSSGAAGMVGAAQSAANSAIGAVNKKQAAAEAAGAALGGALSAGMQAGINAAAAAVAAAAAALVQAAIDRARREAGAHSPSLLFAELGRDMGEGVAVGLADTVGTVTAASTDLITSAAAAVAKQQAEVAQQQATSFRSLNLATPTQPAVSSQTASPNSPAVLFEAGAIQVNVSGVPDRTEADAVGETIGGSIADTLNRRLVRVAARTA